MDISVNITNSSQKTGQRSITCSIGQQNSVTIYCRLSLMSKEPLPSRTMAEMTEFHQNQAPARPPD
jgi:hypothetical protein